ncbi:MAG: hypothetical protein ACTSQY_06520 [Candidatus Odinarchaeia archaeon]
MSVDYSPENLKDSAAKLIIKLNTLYNSHVFTSSRITKEVMKDKKFRKTLFPKVHKSIKKLLKQWSSKNLCVYIYSSKLGRSRKTKEIYQFSEEGITKLKKQVILETFNHIASNKKSSHGFFPTRQQITQRIHEKKLSF